MALVLKKMPEGQAEKGKILDNAFIKDCNIQGIKKYENMLGTMPDMASGI